MCIDVYVHNSVSENNDARNEAKLFPWSIPETLQLKNSKPTRGVTRQQETNITYFAHYPNNSQEFHPLKITDLCCHAPLRSVFYLNCSSAYVHVQTATLLRTNHLQLNTKNNNNLISSAFRGEGIEMKLNVRMHKREQGKSKCTHLKQNMQCILGKTTVLGCEPTY